MTTPSGISIVRFKDGAYGIRRLSPETNKYEYLDCTNITYFWTDRPENAFRCPFKFMIRMYLRSYLNNLRREEAKNNKKTDYGEPIE